MFSPQNKELISLGLKVGTARTTGTARHPLEPPLGQGRISPAPRFLNQRALLLGGSCPRPLRASRALPGREVTKPRPVCTPQDPPSAWEHNTQRGLAWKSRLRQPPKSRSAEHPTPCSYTLLLGRDLATALVCWMVLSKVSPRFIRREVQEQLSASPEPPQLGTATLCRLQTPGAARQPGSSSVSGG